MKAAFYWFCISLALPSLLLKQLPPPDSRLPRALYSPGFPSPVPLNLFITCTLKRILLKALRCCASKGPVPPPTFWTSSNSMNAKYGVWNSAAAFPETFDPEKGTFDYVKWMKWIIKLLPKRHNVSCGSVWYESRSSRDCYNGPWANFALTANIHFSYLSYWRSNGV